MPTSRRNFLRATGFAGVATLWPFGRLHAQTEGECVLIPSETSGPFPLDLTENTFYLRSDVREDRTGIELHLRLKILGEDNCAAMPNVRVNIWHCDKDGNYSGYGSEVGETYLRGYQITDANGEVNFITIFPGWYPGRTCHIHFQVYVNSSYAAISQLTWNHAEKNDLLNAYPDIYTEGPDPVSPGSDGVFADGYSFQTATLSEDVTADVYNSYLEVTVKGSGTTGYMELQAQKYALLAQNTPNPVTDFTQIAFQLHTAATVILHIWNIHGQKISNIAQGTLSAGEHSITLRDEIAKLRSGNYVYQLEVIADKTIFTPAKVMSVL